MRVYVSHSTGFNYQRLYDTLKKSDGGFQIYLPHEKKIEPIDTRKILESSDLVFAEVSYPSTGQGFELAWALDANIPIICAHKREAKISSTLPLFCKTILSYSDEYELLKHFNSMRALSADRH